MGTVGMNVPSLKRMPSHSPSGGTVGRRGFRLGASQREEGLAAVPRHGHLEVARRDREELPRAVAVTTPDRSTNGESAGRSSKLRSMRLRILECYDSFIAKGAVDGADSFTRAGIVRERSRHSQ